MTEIGRAATGFIFNEIDVDNCFPGGVPLTDNPEKTFWTVEAFVAASFFSQPRRDAMQTAIAKAFVEILGDDGSVLEREGYPNFARLFDAGFTSLSSRSRRTAGALVAKLSTRRRSVNSSVPLKARHASLKHGKMRPR